MPDPNNPQLDDDFDEDDFDPNFEDVEELDTEIDDLEELEEDEPDDEGEPIPDDFKLG